MSFNESEFREYLERDEGLLLDFKSLWHGPRERPVIRERREVRDQIAKFVAAFANAEGGVLILRVEDDGTISGHSYPEEAIEDFARVSKSRLEPPIDVAMQRITIGGKELLVFDVAASPHAVMVKGDGFPLRVTDQVVLESEERINARKQAVRAVGWEDLHPPDATLDDLDLDYATSLLARTPHRDRDALDILRRYRLVADAPRGLRVSNAALLLFAKEPARWHPRAGIRIFRVQGIERRHGAQRNVNELARLEAPLARLIDEANERCRAQIRRSEKLHDLFFREIPEYPTFAWQEAIVNAVAHRDYTQRGREIEVWFYDDRMEVVSPGLLVEPVTLDDLRERRSVHASRNPLLVRVLVEAGIMREEGEGIPRMFEEMANSFLQLPEFAVASGGFQVTLRNTPIFNAGNPAWRAIIDRLPISTAQKRVLVAYPNGFVSADYQRLSSVNRDQAYREIQSLVSKGIVFPPGKPGRGALYRISPEIARARDVHERLPKLREFFSREARLTNTSYRELFAVPRFQAGDELRRLCQARVLEPRGEKRGTHYVPGKALEP
jgi:ATP-dependent DNA helicase RecG